MHYLERAKTSQRLSTSKKNEVETSSSHRTDPPPKKIKQSKHITVERKEKTEPKTQKRQLRSPPPATEESDDHQAIASLREEYLHLKKKLERLERAQHNRRGRKDTREAKTTLNGQSKREEDVFELEINLSSDKNRRENKRLKIIHHSESVNSPQKNNGSEQKGTRLALEYSTRGEREHEEPPQSRATGEKGSTNSSINTSSLQKRSAATLMQRRKESIAGSESTQTLSQKRSSIRKAPAGTEHRRSKRRLSPSSQTVEAAEAEAKLLAAAAQESEERLYR